MMNSLKIKIYNLIRDDDENNLSANIFDGFILIMIILNVLMLIMETFDIPLWLTHSLQIFDVFSVIVFSIEYIFRLWTSDLIRPLELKHKARIKYLFSFTSIIDILAILPFYLPYIAPIGLRFLRLLRLLRLFRLIKLNRYTKALNTIGSVLKSKAEQLLLSSFVVFLLMLISSILMYSLENDSQPEVFQNAFSGFWWTLNTITTVGYGDIYPITTLGKILSGIIAVLGIGLIAVPTGIISAGFVEYTENSSKKNDLTVDELLRYNNLLKQGIISEEEFKLIKNKLIKG